MLLTIAINSIVASTRALMIIMKESERFDKQLSLWKESFPVDKHSSFFITIIRDGLEPFLSASFLAGDILRPSDSTKAPRVSLARYA